ncbi:bacteriocin immunity protein [Leuconostoc gelidum subsp. gelidum]|uniref:Bacteriocin immunity protein n=1 Tax=Leuconostoc gelidum subsp. gelidum TaxID=1607839 RepID=A0AB35FZW3_LEUGE|nr:bacteriocin immunity protein [Leuconostoc gelidum]MBZ5965013.1 bacteriocin immunity protein [Leuconostoc gelidum subsp. gelidum]MBZ5974422.1 bacteriocin immunity protein [Leuconostoc gelidum subsp. gelidum]MBZ5977261.1 bacteriocin immunity protein [Leuconostoc gelidum subsp. gelidum]MBZ5986289.1 bacteriocin immunity protein [Leuconostoc gelidum subsp. gelidum]MBZ5998913.1 bacteriocin immunity protein [Leuconostoc gelidum subsp. gelidum]
MTQIKWYTGGQERGKVALELIIQLLKELDGTAYDDLKQVLAVYFNEIKNESGSIPLVFSRMNLDVSNVMIKNHIVLPENAQQTMKKISQLNQLRCGY